MNPYEKRRTIEIKSENANQNSQNGQRWATIHLHLLQKSPPDDDDDEVQMSPYKFKHGQFGSRSWPSWAIRFMWLTKLTRTKKSNLIKLKPTRTSLILTRTFSNNLNWPSTKLDSNLAWHSYLLTWFDPNQLYKKN